MIKIKLINFIKNNKGEYSGGIYIFTIFMLFIFAIFSIFFGKVFIIYSDGQKVKETMKEACLSVMTSNWDELFSSVIEGYAGAYTYDGEELIDEDRVYNIMQKELQTIKIDDTYIYCLNEDLSQVVYKYYNISMKINNTGYKNVNDSFSIDLSLTFEAPFKLLFMEYPMKIELKNRAKWTAKY